MPDASPNTADLFEIIRTTRSMRRLKPDPVPNDLIRKILEAGVCAPSGGNMQRWRFLVIRDRKIKETVGAYYKRAWDERASLRYRAGEPAPGMSRERFLRLLAAAEYLAAHIHEARSRPRRDIDDAPLAVRDGSGVRTRLAAELPLLCLAADRLSHGQVRAGAQHPARRCRL